MSTWREIARELGERMDNHRYCPDHTVDQADPKGCPFCHDRAVYERWYQKEVAALREDRERLRK